MIHGHVNNLEARMNVPLRLEDGFELEFVIDTGFEGALAIPSDTVADLKLSFVQEMAAKLADGAFVQTDIHAAQIIWDGYEADVAVLSMGDRPQLGTALLAGKELNVRFEEDGKVTLTDL